jgi:hypothetical protein
VFDANYRRRGLIIQVSARLTMGAATTCIENFAAKSRQMRAKSIWPDPPHAV